MHSSLSIWSKNSKKTQDISRHFVDGKSLDEKSTTYNRYKRLNGVLKAREFLFFIVFGGIAAIMNLSCGWILYGEGLFPELPYWCATAIAAFCGLIVNFSLNYSFNFKFRRRSAIRQFYTFCVISGVGVVLTSGLSEGFLALCENFAGSGFHIQGARISSKFFAHFLAVGTVVMYSYPAHKTISFNVGLRARLRQLRVLLVGAR